MAIETQPFKENRWYEKRLPADAGIRFEAWVIEVAGFGRLEELKK